MNNENLNHNDRISLSQSTIQSQQIGRPPGPPGRQPEPPGRQPGPPGRQPEPPGRQPGPPGRQPEPPGRQPGPPGRQPGSPGRQPGPPGRPPGPPGRQPGAPGRPPEPPRFGTDGAPLFAPPDFTPQMPFMGPSGPASNQRGATVIGPGQNIRRCLNQFTYVWLINGNNFWFYPTAIRGQYVEGFRWRRNRWEFDRILRSRILFQLCF